MWTVPFLVMMACVIAVDQVSKVLIVRFLYEGQRTLIPGIFRLTYVENEGMAFGLLSEHRWIFLIMATAGILAVGYYFVRYAKGRMLRIGLSLIIAGGIGNMIDRIARGFVVDFLDFCAFPSLWIWVFNVADAAVCVGGALVIIGLIRELIAEEKSKRQGGGKPPADEEGSANG